MGGWCWGEMASWFEKVQFAHEVESLVGWPARRERSPRRREWARARVTASCEVLTDSAS